MRSVQLGATAAEIVTIRGRDVHLRADGRTEVYDLDYVRMLVPYLRGERDVPPLRLVHFRPGMKPWVSLAVVDDDTDDGARDGGAGPDLSGVTIYSGLGTHREMGVHLSRPEAWRMAELLDPVTPEPVPPAGGPARPASAAPAPLVPRPSTAEHEQPDPAVQADG
ncbi:hypothetical protein [Kineococcus sp. NUM-3379]